MDDYDLLPGQNSTQKWWCNKVYRYGVRRADVYICPSEPSRASDLDDVKCGYGFNNTLTDPSPGDDVKSVFEIGDPERTAIIGHCSNLSNEPMISEEMVAAGGGTSGKWWPRGHVPRYDVKAKLTVGRCGFVMANGAVEKKYFSDAVAKDADGKYVLFRK